MSIIFWGSTCFILLFFSLKWVLIWTKLKFFTNVLLEINISEFFKFSLSCLLGFIVVNEMSQTIWFPYGSPPTLTENCILLSLPLFLLHPFLVYVCVCLSIYVLYTDTHTHLELVHLIWGFPFYTFCSLLKDAIYEFPSKNFNLIYIYIHLYILILFFLSFCPLWIFFVPFIF